MVRKRKEREKEVAFYSKMIPLKLSELKEGETGLTYLR